MLSTFQQCALVRAGLAQALVHHDVREMSVQYAYCTATQQMRVNDVSITSGPPASTFEDLIIANMVVFDAEQPEGVRLADAFADDVLCSLVEPMLARDELRKTMRNGGDGLITIDRRGAVQIEHTTYGRSRQITSIEPDNDAGATAQRLQRLLGNARQ